MCDDCGEHDMAESESYAALRKRILDEINQERERQVSLAHGGDTEAFDRSNTRNDWIAFINAYTGRAADKVFRNIRESQTFRGNMIKVAALALAAIESRDKGYC